MSLYKIIGHIWWDSTDNVTSNDHWPPYLVGFHWQCPLKWFMTSISGGIPPTISPQKIIGHIWWDSTDNVTSNDPWPPYLMRFHWQCHLNDHWPPYLVGLQWQCHVNDPWPPYLVGFHRQCLLKWYLTSIYGGIPLTMSPQMIFDLHIWWYSIDNVT